MTPENYLAKLVSLPELKILHVNASRPGWLILEFKSVSKCRACPRCAHLCEMTYDHRTVKLLDSPLRDKKVELRIRKKRYFCPKCKKPFTELLHGIFKGHRLTERCRRNILWCCSRFQSLLTISKVHGCSAMTVWRSFFAHLLIHRRRHLNYGFPKKIGIDEHFFGMSSSTRFQPVAEQKFHTTLVDLKAHRLYRAVKNRDAATVFDQLKNEPGGAGVEEVAMDMSPGYRNLSRALFPNARITVDKFHVLRLLVNPLNKERKKISGDRRKNKIGSLLLKSRIDLDFSAKLKIKHFLEPHPELKALYEFKERLFALYRCHGKRWAEASFNRIVKDLEKQTIQPLKTLRKTLLNWREEILNHFSSRLTNAMTEGFNNKIKLIKRMAYGFRNETVYDLRILYACYH